MTWNLNQLERELEAAGVEVRGLGTAHDPPRLITWNEKGELIDLPPEAQPVIEAHVPQETPSPDEQLDAAIAAATTLAELKAALRGESGLARVAGRMVER
ncbi:MAG: hypothetical protein GEU71_03685 [Actinobacteria bacterium]|nr:hypothetical protein [Actinomycetota bacterium]